MELYFIMKTVLWKTVLIARQIYMYISLVMKCQQLQMKLLYPRTVITIVSYLQKERVFVVLKDC